MVEVINDLRKEDGLPPRSPLAEAAVRQMADRSLAFPDQAGNLLR